ncbi:MAG: methyl-accepting chemotaxis protein [Verrucomicrobiota bacterium]
MKISLNNLSLKAKLVGFVGVAFALLIVLAVAVVINYLSIESTYTLRANINQIAKKILDSQGSGNTATGDALDEMKKQSEEAFCAGEAELKSIGSSAAEMRAKFQEYQNLFKEFMIASSQVNEIKADINSTLVSAQKDLDVIINTLTEKQFELRMSGDELSAQEIELLNIARDCKVALLKFETTFQQQSITGGADEGVLANFKTKTTKEINDALKSLTVLVPSTKNNDFIQKSKTIKTNTERIMPLVESGTLAIQQQLKVAGQMKETSDAILEASDRLLVSQKSKAVTIISTMIIGGMLGFAVLSFFLVTSITKPMKVILDNMTDIAQGKGDLTVRLKIFSKDEIGQMAARFNDFVEKLQGIMKEVGSNVTPLASSADEMTSTATHLATSAEQMKSQAYTVASAGEQLSHNINTMASTAEEMSISADNVATSVKEMTASIGEVAKNCARESEIASKANQQAVAAREVMSKLGDAVQEISKVVELIGAIADQTNLLALNATIEAASAGEAGKGFAVVANEVKELARQSSQASEQIAGQIRNVQTSTETSVKTIEEVSKIIQEVNQIAGNIASAMEEQSATTNEIFKTITGVSEASRSLAKNVQESAKGANEVSKNIQGVNSAAQESASGASQTHDNSSKLSQMASRLKEIVGTFKV